MEHLKGSFDSKGSYGFIHCCVFPNFSVFPIDVATCQVYSGVVRAADLGGLITLDPGSNVATLLRMRSR